VYELPTTYGNNILCTFVSSDDTSFENKPKTSRALALLLVLYLKEYHTNLRILRSSHPIFHSDLSNDINVSDFSGHVAFILKVVCYRFEMRDWIVMKMNKFFVKNSVGEIYKFSMLHS
jgi:hypothetical protein